MGRAPPERPPGPASSSPARDASLFPFLFNLFVPGSSMLCATEDRVNHIRAPRCRGHARQPGGRTSHPAARPRGDAAPAGHECGSKEQGPLEPVMDKRPAWPPGVREVKLRWHRDSITPIAAHQGRTRFTHGRDRRARSRRSEALDPRALRAAERVREARREAGARVPDVP